MITTTNNGLKAIVFHWIGGYFDTEKIAKGEVSFIDVVEEMSMLNMEDLVKHNHTTVYGAYRECCEHWADFHANHL